MRVAVDLVLELSPDLCFVSCAPSFLLPTLPTLTSSKGALPTQTTAPLAAPANRLVSATSSVESRFRIPSRRLIHGALPLASVLVSTVPGSEFRIRFVAL